MKLEKEWKCFGGVQRVFSHDSSSTKTGMQFAVFDPPQSDSPPLVLYFLSGLTCTWENFVTKAGAQRAAAEHNVRIVCPDTSPRGEGVPDVPERDDLGKGAGFYLDAKMEPWATHFQMKTYVTRELPTLVEGQSPPAHRAICGHSMGGHGALTLGILEPDFYHSLSAFSPIVAASQVPWGQNALGSYLGQDEEQWKKHDACELLLSRGYQRPILIDQGSSDPFLQEQLRPELFAEASKKSGVASTIRLQPGYDHSYYFISTFISEHVAWHREAANSR